MQKVKTPATYLFSGWNETNTEYLRDQEKEITVGQGCTVGIGSDSYPYHVSRISDSGKTVWIKRANYFPAEGHDYFAEQKYIIVPNMNASEERVTKRKNGRWQTTNGFPVGFGVCRYYQDPSF